MTSGLGAHLRDAVAMLVQAFGALPVDAECAGPAGGERAAVLDAAHEARHHHAALRGGFLFAARPRAVVGRAAVHWVARGARVLQGDGARGAVRIALHPRIRMVNPEQAVHLCTVAIVSCHASVMEK